ncbi:MAG: 50S ribosomal protein L10 [Candidatus Magnetoovum sp. WYHC-5]|nr:50S ribosomal protein L10 [Candidatus Magnetoovum sp. WYHC-5]
MLDKARKEELINELNNKLKGAKAVLFTDYKGMSVAELTTIRLTLRQSNIEYKVVKNTLAKRATEGTSIAVAKDVFKGPIGLIIGFDDPVAVPKQTFVLAKGNDKLKVLCGVIEGHLYSKDDLVKISKLPGREVLLAQLGGVMKAPATKLATVLNATVARFGYALNALKEKKSAAQTAA